jgi:hypothetical protein
MISGCELTISLAAYAKAFTYNNQGGFGGFWDPGRSTHCKPLQFWWLSAASSLGMNYKYHHGRRFMYSNTSRLLNSFVYLLPTDFVPQHYMTPGSCNVPNQLHNFERPSCFALVCLTFML